jgi:hypothetical protein
MSSLHKDILSLAALVDELAAFAPDEGWVKAPVASAQRALAWQDITHGCN